MDLYPKLQNCQCNEVFLEICSWQLILWTEKAAGHASRTFTLQAGVLYGYKVAGDGGWDTGHRWDPDKILADPYAPLLKGRARWGQRDAFESFTQVRLQTLSSLSCSSVSNLKSPKMDGQAIAGSNKPALTASQSCHNVALLDISSADTSGC